MVKKADVPEFMRKAVSALHERDPIDYIFGDGTSEKKVTPRRMRSKDQKLISQAGVYLNPSENCPVSKNLKTIKHAKRAIRMAKGKQMRQVADRSEVVS